MKTFYTFLLVTLFAIGANAQLLQPFTFETEEAAASWVIFANGAAMAPENIVVVENPDKSDPNTSANVLQFTVFPDADPWVGMKNEVDLLDADGKAMVFTEDDHIITMMVYKTVISPMIMKLENRMGGGDPLEAKVSNTLVDEWELITFDLSVAIGLTFEKLVVFPDFPTARTDGTVVYLDNITSPGAEEIVSSNQISKSSLKVYPNPAENMLFVQQEGMTGFSISNLSGQTVETSIFQSANSKSIELYNLKSGVYFLTAKSERGNFTSRFIKK
jgi:hypothetical protein